ncbi:MAG: glycosyltransferase, partial [Candidatus Lokiarchaeota archaeon]|nr:glycosyltransferase [Candidatus Lokiarchaeota archaeon]
TCNRPKLLKTRSLKSINDQSRRPNLLIIVDDSSKSVRYENKRITNDLYINNKSVIYLENAHKKGVSGAWNTGLEKILDINPDSYIAILDDDDAWDKNYLKRCELKTIRQELDMCIAGIIRYDDINSLGFKTSIPQEFKIDQFLIGNPNVQGSNLFVKLRFLKKVGFFDESLVSSTDRDICIRLAEIKSLKVGFINEHLVHHYAISEYPRLSDKDSSKKIEGLKSFYGKYKSRMTTLQRIKFLKRAKRLFGLEEIENKNLDEYIQKLQSLNKINNQN